MRERETWERGEGVLDKGSGSAEWGKRESREVGGKEGCLDIKPVVRGFAKR